VAFSPKLHTGSDRPQTRGAGALGNKYFSDGALGITLARQTADRGLKSSQRPLQNKTHCSLGQTVPSSGLHVCLIFKNRCSAAVPSFNFLRRPTSLRGFELC